MSTSDVNSIDLLSNSSYHKNDMEATLMNMMRDGYIKNSTAKEFITPEIDLSFTEARTGFTLLHMAAAIGSRSLVDAFCEAGSVDFQARDARGRTAADLAAIVAGDMKLCKHIYDLEAKAMRP